MIDLHLHTTATTAFVWIHTDQSWELVQPLPGRLGDEGEGGEDEVEQKDEFKEFSMNVRDFLPVSRRALHLGASLSWNVSSTNLERIRTDLVGCTCHSIVVAAVTIAPSL